MLFLKLEQAASLHILTFVICHSTYAAVCMYFMDLSFSPSKDDLPVI